MNFTRRNRQIVLLIAVLVVALATYFLMNRVLLEGLIEALERRGLLKTAVYLAWMSCGFVVFAAVLLTARALGLFLLLALTLFSTATNYAYKVIVKQEITPDYMEWMVQELGHAASAWSEFRPEIVAAAVQAFVFVAIFLAIRRWVRRRSVLAPAMWGAPRVRLGAVIAFLAFHGAAMLLQPSYGLAETNVVVFGVPALLGARQIERTPVSHKPSSPPLADKIVLIVDESVAHDAYERWVAPVLKGAPVIGYGRGSSVAACSAAANALLRWGVAVSRISDPRYDPRTNPTIWAYARAAGYKTVLIDGQSKGAFQNYLGSSELALIDEFVAADIGLETDVRLAEMLKRRLAVPRREFIYVIKRGSHFGYDANYPPGMTPEGAPRLEKYFASISYTTVRFFQALLPLPVDRALLIYTSDHGQNLDSRAPHCSGQHDPREYAVPLVAMTEAPAIAEALRAGQPRMRDRASHVNVFPTVLWAMGYSKEAIESVYGPALTGPPSDFVWLDGWLPHPTRRSRAVTFRRTPVCPGCDAPGG